MKTPEFSIIIPVYNVAEYLRECLDSLLIQITGNEEVILVDDGSTDDSGNICDMYAADCAAVRVIHKQNGGVASARNVGLHAARGEYLAWLDPDDWIESDWLAAIRERLAEYGRPDMLIYDMRRHEADGEKVIPYGRNEGMLDMDMLLYDIVEDRRIQSGLCNKVMRRGLFEGLRFDENLRLLEDYDLMHTLVMRAGSAAYLPRALYNYRILDSGLTHLRGLDVSWQSVTTAVKRRNDIRKAGRKCGYLGIYVQARWFCHFYCMYNCPADFRGQYKACRRLMARSIPELVMRKGAGHSEKMRDIFWALPGTGGIYKKRHGAGGN
ncbi:MAG: glycosyltransferase family 2 protein [Clostridia bacterium]|nr:glycosyltransferase family 2 protein [Clostridia bacterium]